MKTFKKGYHLEITTYEGDADNYKTETVVYPWSKSAHAANELCKYFRSRYNKSEDGKKLQFGNAKYINGSFGSVDGRIVFNANDFYKFLLEQQPEIVHVLVDDAKKSGEWIYTEEEFSKEKTQADVIYEIVSELVGFWGDCDYVRVVENVKCYYVPQDTTFDEIKL